MTTARQRRCGFGFVAALIVVVPTATACGVGQQAETKKEYFGQGSYYDLNQLHFQGLALLASSEAGSGTADLEGVVYNESSRAQQIISLRLPQGGTFVQQAVVSPSASAPASSAPPASAAPGAGLSPITVPQGGHITFGPSGDYHVVATGLPTKLRVGETIPMQIVASTGSVQNFPLPINLDTGTTALSTPITATPTPAPSESEEIDPRWSIPPYDDIHNPPPTTRPGTTPGT